MRNTPQNRIIHTVSARDTERAGRALCKRLRPGSIILLEGTIGSGKTTFLRGVAKQLGITHPITSPTFVLRKRYPLTKRVNGIAAINHVDAYRLQSSEELRGVIDEYIEDASNELWAVEWGSQIRGALPQNAFLITFRVVSHTARSIVIVPPALP